jgi:hypothetical protein
MTKSRGYASAFALFSFQLDVPRIDTEWILQLGDDRQASPRLQPTKAASPETDVAVPRRA